MNENPATEIMLVGKNDTSKLLCNIVEEWTGNAKLNFN